jgi:hypothetical protein
MAGNMAEAFRSAKTRITALLVGAVGLHLLVQVGDLAPMSPQRKPKHEKQ